MNSLPEDTRPEDQACRSFQESHTCHPLKPICVPHGSPDLGPAHHSHESTDIIGRSPRSRFFFFSKRRFLKYNWNSLFSHYAILKRDKYRFMLNTKKEKLLLGATWGLVVKMALYTDHETDHLVQVKS